MRNPIRKKEEEIQTPDAQIENPTMQVIEREITLSLLNDKINYITGLLHKIVEAAEIDLDKK